jgi:hypothetical protein
MFCWGLLYIRMKKGPKFVMVTEFEPNDNILNGLKYNYLFLFLDNNCEMSL